MSDLILSSPTFITKSLGCRTNQAEVESISSELLNHGFLLADSTKTPDIVLLNTCVVTQKAEKETRQEMRYLRKKFPYAFLVVLGCAATAKEKFNILLPEVDLLIPNEQKNRTVEIIEQKYCSSLNKESVLINKYISSGRKFIKIQDGCNNFCSFCLTVHLRGKPTSIPIEKVIKEINYWIEKGVKEVILTGINIGLYPNIICLLKKITIETKIERVSFSSIYPEMLTDEFLNIVVGNSRITQCFHLSLQSGSQTVLERMKRKTNLNDLQKKLNWVKSKNPFFTFRADVITGFPDETEKEFQETLEFVQEARISFAHIFTYSSRKGTAAYEMVNTKKWQDLSEAIKKERSEKTRTVVKKIREEEGKKIVGSFSHCLIVRKQKEGWEGITENGWPTRISIKKQVLSIKGKIVPVKIINYYENYLLGESL